MRLQFETVDVFTSEQFGGNPLAVVLNAEGLSPAQMHAIAAEFNRFARRWPRESRGDARVSSVGKLSRDPVW